MFALPKLNFVGPGLLIVCRGDNQIVPRSRDWHAVLLRAGRELWSYELPHHPFGPFFTCLILVVDPGVGLLHAGFQSKARLPVEILLDQGGVAVAAVYS